MTPDWDELWALVTADGVAAAAWAAVPGLVAAGAAAPATEQASYWHFVGVVAAARAPDDVPPDVLADAERAFVDAAPHVTAAIAARPADESIWYLLAASAALRGLGLVATALEDFVAGVATAACPHCDADVEIVHEDATPPDGALAPVDPAPSDWTEDDATARLLALAELAGRPDVADVLARWEGTAACPECDERFAIRPAHLAYHRSWANA